MSLPLSLLILAIAATTMLADGSSAVGGDCSDTPSFLDSEQNGCDWYQDNFDQGNCYGAHLYEDAMGSASNACCWCQKEPVTTTSSTLDSSVVDVDSVGDVVDSVVDVDSAGDAAGDSAGDSAAAVGGAVGWRLLAHSSDVNQHWLWQVQFIELFSSADCSDGSKVDPATGTIIESGNAGEHHWPAVHAFTQDGVWGGKDDQGLFWIGLDHLSPPVAVRCVKVTQTSQHVANYVTIQSRSSSSDDDWEDVYETTLEAEGVNTIVMEQP